MSKTSLSNGSILDSKINSLLSSTQWGSQNGFPVTITYSFPESGSTWVSDYANGEPFSPNSYSSFTSSQRQDFREALATWSEVANITFLETNDTEAQGDIRIAFSSVVDGGTAGYSYGAPEFTAEEYASKFSNGTSIHAASGDIWMNSTENDLSQESQNGFATLVHEIGHSLGLKHTFTVDLNNPIILTGSEDSNQYSIMSYTSYDIGYKENESSYTTSSGFTPMLYDVAAIQFLYGANTTTRTDNDTYTFSNTEPELKTIWDAGGIDTFDLSNQTLTMIVDLTEGNYSSIGIKYVSDGQFIETNPVTTTNNIAIAYGAEIENAIGGSGNDVLIGNTLANQLTGGDGNDTINGGAGNDTINGGAGIDTSVYSSAKQAFVIQKANNQISITDQQGSEGLDSLFNIERLQFSDTRLAFDTGSTESAGMTARLLVAAFGSDSLANKVYTGIGISLFDGGSTFEEVSQLAIDTGLVSAPNNTDFISSVWKNVVGTPIDPDSLQYYTQLLDNNSLTQSSLLVLASKTDLASNIVQTIGVNDIGLEFAV
jgi:serralysin